MFFYGQVTELKRQVEIYKKLAYTDDLTGLGNYRAFKEFDYSQYDWLTFIDLNDLHKTNKEKGFIEGNNRILEVANLIKQLQYSKNCVGFRIGGDEFVTFHNGFKYRLNLYDVYEKYDFEYVCQKIYNPLDDAIQRLSLECAKVKDKNREKTQ
jgi:GGDEF domain-containing protein